MGHTIILYERIHERGLSLLRAAGEVIAPESLEEEALLPLFARADAVVVRAMGQVSRRLMESAPRLKVVGRHGAGVDNIDIAAASELGIWVVNTPAAPAESLAEQFLLLALALCRHFRQAERALRRGEWNQRQHLVGKELAGKTVGIIGFGNTGRLIARKCHAAFDNRVLYSDPVRAPAEVEQVVIEAKYAGYIARQQVDIQRQSRLATRRIPDDLDYLNHFVEYLSPSENHALQTDQHQSNKFHQADHQ
jgi:D-3-phosphoglycerate dehydrogenase